MIPIRPLSRLFGALRHEGPTVTLQDMERAVADRANDNQVFKRSKKAGLTSGGVFGTDPGFCPFPKKRE